MQARGKFWQDAQGSDNRDRGANSVHENRCEKKEGKLGIKISRRLLSKSVKGRFVGRSHHRPLLKGVAVATFASIPTSRSRQWISRKK